MKPLTARQARFVNVYLSGKSATEAARQAGYREAYAHKAPQTILKHPSVAVAVRDAQNQLRGKTMFDMEQAVHEADEMIIFARAKGNAMAAAKLLELKCKLHGLLIERIETQPRIDLTDVLNEARIRVLRVINPPGELEAPVRPVVDKKSPFG